MDLTRTYIARANQRGLDGCRSVEKRIKLENAKGVKAPERTL